MEKKKKCGRRKTGRRVQEERTIGRCGFSIERF